MNVVWGLILAAAILIIWYMFWSSDAGLAGAAGAAAGVVAGVVASAPNVD
jgi:hypothetical protein